MTGIDWALIGAFAAAVLIIAINALRVLDGARDALVDIAKEMKEHNAREAEKLKRAGLRAK